LLLPSPWGPDEAAAVLREMGRVPQDSRTGVHRQRRRAGLRHVRLHWPGGEVGLSLVLTKGSEGTYSAVDLYARPWPFVKLVRDHLVVSDERFRDDVDLSVPYVAAGPPGGFRTEPPSLPGLSADVAFHSPVLTATATGGELVSVILKAVG
jgi:hypothetical protein